MVTMQSMSMQGNNPRRSAQEGSTMQLRRCAQHAVAGVLVLLSLASSPVQAQPRAWIVRIAIPLMLIALNAHSQSGWGTSQPI
jgi:hypothetical protein